MFEFEPADHPDLKYVIDTQQWKLMSENVKQLRIRDRDDEGDGWNHFWICSLIPTYPGYSNLLEIRTQNGKVERKPFPNGEERKLDAKWLPMDYQFGW